MSPGTSDSDEMKRKDLLSQWKTLTEKCPGPIKNSVTLGREQGLHVAVGFCVHGNEVGSFPGILKFIQDHFQTDFPGKFTFFLGNEEAFLRGVRFCDYDLNRCFGNCPREDSQEFHRAQDIKKILDACDYFIDFHQTIMPTKHSFYIFPNHPESIFFARFLGAADFLITRNMKQRQSADGMNSDEYVRKQGKPGVTIELSQAGISDEVTNVVKNVLKKILILMNKSQQKYFSLQRLSRSKKEFHILWQVYKEPFSHPKMQLNPGLQNLEFVKNGQDIGTDEKGNMIRVPRDGFLLFPKYPKRDDFGAAVSPYPSEIYVMCAALGAVN